MRLKTFGTLALLRDGESASGTPLFRRPLAMIATLAVAGEGGMTRDRLIGLFWSEQDPDNARHSLGQAIYVARRALSAAHILESAGSISLDASLLPSDVGEFRAALARGDHASAVEVYAGPFLDGVYLSDAASFSRWVDEQRDAFARSYVASLTELADGAAAAGDHAHAVSFARRAAASAPLSSAAARVLMAALYEAGDRPGALEAGRIHAALVRQELEAEADPAVTEMMAAIRAGTLRPSHRRTPLAVRSEAGARSPAPGPDAARAADVRPPSAFRVRRVALTGAAFTLLLLVGAPRPVSVARGASAASGISEPRQITFTGAADAPLISPDGRLVAYASDSGLYVQALESGEPVRVPTDSLGQEVAPSSWSSDGTELRFIVRRRGQRWPSWYAVPALGGHIRALEPGPRDAGNYHWMAHVAGPGSPGLWFGALDWADTTVRDTLRLPPGFFQVFFPAAISPDRRWVAAAGVRHDSPELVVVSVDGRASHAIAADGTIPQWSARDTIDFLRFSQRALMMLPVDSISAEATGPANVLFSDPALRAFSFSADRRRVVYARERTRGQVLLLTLQGAPPRASVTAAPITWGTASNLGPAISPDGRSVAYVRRMADREDVYLQPSSGGPAVRATSLGAGWYGINGLTWSPDGTRFAFVLRTGGGLAHELYDVRSGELHQVGGLVPESTNMLQTLVWADSGRTLVTVSAEENGTEGLVAYDVPTGRATGLLGPTDSIVFVQLGAASPDGRRIALLLQRGAHHELAILSLDDRSLRIVLTKDAGVPIAWARDGTITYRRGPTATDPLRELWRLPASGGEPRRLAALPKDCGAGASASADLSRLVCATSAQETDLWVRDRK